MKTISPERKPNDMRLLLVEDETALSEALSEILNQNGYLTDCVSNGVDGLDYICTGIYDLVLLDIMLPGMDGLSVLKKCGRKNPYSRDFAHRQIRTVRHRNRSGRRQRRLPAQALFHCRTAGQDPGPWTPESAIHGKCPAV